MAIAVASSASVTYALGTSRAITKPTGLAVGNLMIAVVSTDSGTPATVNTPSGWTAQASFTFDSGQAGIAVFTRIADSGDVSASDFTFSTTASTFIGGVILRVTGHPASGFFDVSDTDFNNTASSSTISFSSTITPAVNGTLIIGAFQGTLGGAGTGTMSGYTASDGTLSWTEVADISVDNGTRDPIFGVAYAIQTTATQITTYGSTLSATRTNHGALLVAFKPQIDATGTTALLVADADFFSEASVTVGGTGTNALLQADADFFNQSGIGTSPTPWTPETKVDTTWTHETK